MRKIVALLALVLAAAQAPPLLAAESPAPAPTPAALLPDQLFSRRALRQARIIIQMRMLQLHDERLECVRAALLRRLPEALLPEPPSPTERGSAAAEATARCD